MMMSLQDVKGKKRKCKYEELDYVSLISWNFLKASINEDGWSKFLRTMVKLFRLWTLINSHMMNNYCLVKRSMVQHMDISPKWKSGDLARFCWESSGFGQVILYENANKCMVCMRIACSSLIEVIIGQTFQILDFGAIEIFTRSLTSKLVEVHTRNILLLF